MHCLRLALLPLLVVGCADTPPAAPDLDAGPTFDASAEHAAFPLVRDPYITLFDAQGGITTVACRSIDVFTQSETNMVSSVAHCWTPNPTGKAVVYTPERNPIGPVCGSLPDPDGIKITLCNWREVIAANGDLLFHIWGTPVYP